MGGSTGDGSRDRTVPIGSFAPRRENGISPVVQIDMIDAVIDNKANKCSCALKMRCGLGQGGMVG